MAPSMTQTPPLRSYGRRKSKPLSARKERLFQELLPRFASTCRQRQQRTCGRFSR